MRALLEVAVVFVVVAVAAYFAFPIERASTPEFWLIVGVPYVVLGAYAAARQHRDGVLAPRMTPRWGDFSKAFIAAAALFAAALAVRRYVLTDGPRGGWLVRVYLQFGDAAAQRSRAGLVLACMVTLATAQEFVWRGLVTDALATQLGSRRAWVWSAVLYALAQAPTAWALRDGRAGPNPLVMLAALGAGLVFGWLVRKEDRLAPAILAHVLFDWCVLVAFPLWGVGSSAAPRM